MRPFCEECAGQGGVYLMPNGDVYLNDEPGSTWHGCEVCGGSGLPVVVVAATDRCRSVLPSDWRYYVREYAADWPEPDDRQCERTAGHVGYGKPVACRAGGIEWVVSQDAVSVSVPEAWEATKARGDGK